MWRVLFDCILLSSKAQSMCSPESPHRCSFLSIKIVEYIILYQFSLNLKDKLTDSRWKPSLPTEVTRVTVSCL